MRTEFLKFFAFLAFFAVFASAAPKTLYVLAPESKEWLSDDLMIRTDGKDVAMNVAPDMCGWYYTTFDNVPKSTLFFLKNNPDMRFGIDGLWGKGDATPIDLSVIYDSYGKDTLFFILDNNKWPDDDASQGWYLTNPGFFGSCTINFYYLIYDGDPSVNPVFFTSSKAHEFSDCADVYTGIVEKSLGADGKPVFSGSENARKCFGSEENFKTLFNYAKDVSEEQCSEVSFSRSAEVPQWSFSFDSIQQEISAKTSQQFCYESHAYFVYNEDQKLTISGDGDIWVFINNRLAVDLGGAHLAVPGYLALEDLNTTYGKDFLKSGERYPIAIFGCNRDADMSNNLSIKSNIFAEQWVTEIDSSGLPEDFDGMVCFADENGSREISGGGGCSDFAKGVYQKLVAEPCYPSEAATYSIKTREGKLIAELPKNEVSYGGFDLTNPANPVIYPDKITGLEPGEYRLYIELDGKSTYWAFRILDPSEVIPKFSGVPAGMGFRVQSLGSSLFSIVLPLAVNVAEPYAVMDLQGRIVSRGLLNSQVTNVALPASGSYVVKVGSQVQRVNLR